MLKIIIIRDGRILDSKTGNPSLKALLARRGYIPFKL